MEPEPSSPQFPASAEPTVEPVVEPEPSVDIEFEEPDFGAITEFVEGDGEEEPPVEPVAEEQVIPAEATPPEEPAVEVPVSESPPTPEGEVPPVEVAAAVEEPPVVTPEPTPEPEVVVEEPEPIKVPTREELEGMYVEHRAKTLPQLETLFTLSEEEAAALDERPSQVVPKLAAQMQYDAMLSSYNAVMAALPTVIQTYLAANKKADAAQVQFYDAWPDLDQPDRAPAVSAAIHAYRAANPKAALKDIVKNAGVMAMINLGLDPMVKGATAKPAPVVVPVVTPAVPVAPGGVSPIPPTPPTDEDENVFAELTDIFLEEHS